jgi:hypothetical protein
MATDGLLHYYKAIIRPVVEYAGARTGVGLGGLAPAKLKVSPPNKPQCSPPKDSAQL